MIYTKCIAKVRRHPFQLSYFHFTNTISVISVKTITKNFVQLCCISFGVSFSFSLIQFCGLIFFITHLGWTHELLNIWTAAPSCRSALLKTCKHAFVWTTDTTDYSCYTANENFQEDEVLSQQNHHVSSYKADMISCKDKSPGNFMTYEGLLLQIKQQSCRTHTYWPNKQERSVPMSLSAQVALVNAWST